MRAIDTNVLVHAEVDTGKHHERALSIIAETAESARPWVIPWSCIYEFLRVVTHARVFHPPVPMERALGDLGRVLSSPTLILLNETAHHAELMTDLIRGSAVEGNLVHDAHIAALCLEHGVTELVTGDRDFSRFPGLKTFDPFR